MPRKIDLGEALAALGALLLLIALFLEWFDRATGWEAFESLDLILALLALGVLAIVAGAVDGLGSRLLPPLGVLLLAIVVVQIVEPPPSVRDGDLGSGAWLGLAGAALVLIGGALRVAKFSVTVSVGNKDVRKRVAAVDRRQAAAGGGSVAVPPTEGAPAPASGPSSDSVLDEPTQATQPFSALEER